MRFVRIDDDVCLHSRRSDSLIIGWGKINRCLARDLTELKLGEQISNLGNCAQLESSWVAKAGPG
jgi:hypothetical protein